MDNEKIIKLILKLEEMLSAGFIPVVKELRNVATETDKAKQSLDVFDTSMQKLSKMTLNELKQQLKLVKAAFQDEEQQTVKNAVILKRMEAAYNSLKAAQDKVVASSKSVRAATDEEILKMHGAQLRTELLGKSKEQLIAIEQKLRVQIASTGNAMTAQQAAQISTMQSLIKSIDRVDEGYNRAGQSTQDIMRRTAALLLVLRGLRSAWDGVTKAAGEFELEFANVTTLLDTNTTDVEMLRQGILDLSLTVPGTAKEIAEGMYFIHSAMDVTEKESLQLMETISQGAVAARTDMATFSQAITGLLNAYHLEVTEATRVSDLFFQTVADGVLVGEDLARGLGKVTPAANVAGDSLEDLMAMIVAITKEGGTAAMNFTKLRAALVELRRDKATDVFGVLGEENPQLKTTIELIGILAEKKQKLAEGEWQRMLASITSNKRAADGISVLVSQYTLLLEQQEKNTDASGAMSEAFGKIATTFWFSSEQMRASIYMMQEAIGRDLLPALIALQNMIKWLTQHYPRLNRGLRVLIESMVIVGGVMLSAALMNALFNVNIGLSIVNAAKATRTFFTTGIALKDLAASFLAASGAAGGFAGILNALFVSSPVGWVLLLAGVLYALGSAFRDTDSEATDLAETFDDKVATSLDKIIGKFEDLQTTMGESGTIAGRIRKKFEQEWADMGEFISIQQQIANIEAGGAFDIIGPDGKPMTITSADKLPIPGETAGYAKEKARKLKYLRKRLAQLQDEYAEGIQEAAEAFAPTLTESEREYWMGTTGYESIEDAFNAYVKGVDQAKSDLQVGLEKLDKMKGKMDEDDRIEEIARLQVRIGKRLAEWGVIGEKIEERLAAQRKKEEMNVQGPVAPTRNEIIMSKRPSEGVFNEGISVWQTGEASLKNLEAKKKGDREAENERKKRIREQEQEDENRLKRIQKYYEAVAKYELRTADLQADRIERETKMTNLGIEHRGIQIRNEINANEKILQIYEKRHKTLLFMEQITRKLAEEGVYGALSIWQSFNSELDKSSTTMDKLVLAIAQLNQESKKFYQRATSEAVDEVVSDIEQYYGHQAKMMQLGGGARPDQILAYEIQGKEAVLEALKAIVDDEDLSTEGRDKIMNQIRVTEDILEEMNLELKKTVVDNLTHRLDVALQGLWQNMLQTAIRGGNISETFISGMQDVMYIITQHIQQRVTAMLAKSGMSDLMSGIGGGLAGMGIALISGLIFGNKSKGTDMPDVVKAFITNWPDALKMWVLPSSYFTSGRYMSGVGAYDRTIVNNINVNNALGVGALKQAMGDMGMLNDMARAGF